MLKYSDKLDKYIRSVIPLLTLSNKYRIIGSYGKTKFITDIDISNYVEDNINFQKKLNEIITKLPNNIKMFTLTSGFYKDYDVPWSIINENKVDAYNYIKSINFINELYFNKQITEKERDFCNGLLDEIPIIRNLILIEDLLYPKSKIKWNIHEIKKGVKYIGNNELELNSNIRDNDNNILHFIIEYQDDIIPVDVALIKENVNKKNNIENQFDKKIYLMFVKKEYYFILGYLKKYFRDNKKEFSKIKYLLDDKWGYYKQIMMNLFYLIQFLEYPIYNDNEFKKIYDTIMNKINILDIDQDILDEIKINFNNKEKLKELLKKLEAKIMLILNLIFKDIASQYYLKISHREQIKFANLVF